MSMRLLRKTWAPGGSLLIVIFPLNAITSSNLYKLIIVGAINKRVISNRITGIISTIDIDDNQRAHNQDIEF